jgi:hypothetical protein
MLKLGAVLGVVALLAFVAIILAWPTQLLWNYCLVGAVDGVHQITFLQALGINILFSILFKDSNSNSK